MEAGLEMLRHTLLRYGSSNDDLRELIDDLRHNLSFGLLEEATADREDPASP